MVDVIDRMGLSVGWGQPELSEGPCTEIGKRGVVGCKR